MWRTLWLYDAGTQVATGPGPRRERGGEGVRETIRRALIVDTPTSKVRPRLLGAALHGEPDQRQLVDGARKLIEGQDDVGVRIGGVIDRVPERTRQTIEQREPHPQTQTRLTWRRRGAERQLHGAGVEDREETNDPVQPRFRRSKEQQ